MNQNFFGNTNVINVLVSNDRSEMGKYFGVGLMVSAKDTPAQVINKCNSYISRYESYIKNLKEVVESGAMLESEMRKAKATNLLSTLSPEEKKALLEQLQ